MKLENQTLILSFGDETLKASLENNATVREFIQSLPVTFTMNDLFNREKFVEVNDLEVERTISNYSRGDISYWTPGKALVIYYKDDDEPIHGLVKLGEILEGTERLENYPGSIEVKIDIE
ncbi:cyclophilin-like fold protein [Guptibacillus hwajinpoensis]|uniref:cyclophilin-like fold protein n=1 Tax=Guptibacillus hwajinpoensis TaxID=208199 RepID=UPI00384DE2AD